MGLLAASTMVVVILGADGNYTQEVVCPVAELQNGKIIVVEGDCNEIKSDSKQIILSPVIPPKSPVVKPGDPDKSPGKPPKAANGGPKPDKDKSDDDESDDEAEDHDEEDAD